MSVWKQAHIFDAIARERCFQDEKAERKGWKKNKTSGEYLNVLRAELAEAEHAWIKLTHEEVMCEILQIAAVAVACIEQNGLVERRQLLEAPDGE